MNEQPNITPTEMQLRAQLAAKIVAVTEAIGKMAKDGRNEQQRYDFVSYESLNAKFRELLPQFKLALIPSVDSMDDRDMTSSKGTAVVRTLVRGTMSVVDVETGYTMKCGFAGADNDTAGKSGGKAITEAIKRFEMKLFHVSTKDDVDPDSMGQEAYPQQQQQYQQPPSQGWGPTGQGGYR